MSLDSRIQTETGIVRPHRRRVISVTDSTLSVWHTIMEDEDEPVLCTRMVYTTNRAAADVLSKLSAQPRIASLKPEFSPGWHESNDRKRGYFELGWGAPNAWDRVIIQGPHLYVATPIYKFPNRTMKNKLDWSSIDLEHLFENAVPVTAYKPLGSWGRYNSSYTQWSSGAARAQYRIAWRRMGVSTNERTLISALIPPGAAHIDAVSSAGIPGDPESLVTLSAFLSSLDSGLHRKGKGKGRPAQFNNKSPSDRSRASFAT